MSIKPLFSDPDLLHLERVSSEPDRITLIVKTKSRQALCPQCHSPSAHLQSRIPEMKSLAVGIERDRAAEVAALAYEWNNGATEGRINRLKTLKRAVYGRAKFDLLRIKVLAGPIRGAG
jgi:transposase